MGRLVGRELVWGDLLLLFWMLWLRVGGDIAIVKEVEMLVMFQERIEEAIGPAGASRLFDSWLRGGEQ
tara:strand:+ start:72 stop:275 length:204 start_codon:yes stop_codon:yes gene_type:complete